MLFIDRADAGSQLAKVLDDVITAEARNNACVLALPRGGVPVASPVASVLAAPLDVIVVRKLGAPGHAEFAVGAIGEGIRVLNDDVIAQLRVSRRQLESIEQRERAELTRRLALYRAGLPALDVDGRTVVIVDDGIATGATSIAACQVARALGAMRVVLAVPVAPDQWAPPREAGVDVFVCLAQPTGFMAVGQWYRDFEQTSDDEVARLLTRARRATEH